MSSENPNSLLSELVSSLIPLLKKEMKKNDRKNSDDLRRGVNGDCECQSGKRRHSKWNRSSRVMGSEPVVVCKDNPRRCYIEVDGYLEPIGLVNDAGVFVASHIIDQAIVLAQANLHDQANQYVSSAVDHLCGNEPRKRYPFPWPLPRDFSADEFSRNDWYFAAVEFQNAAKAIVGDETLRGLFRAQASKLLEQSLKTPDLP